ncbi:MAG TPA: cob(I)yrinic acid a,c-diamide adenosyltransferase [Mycobacteriales bacterium]|jgi:cob(I)alamin adenosyltransferase|nr:cob(I)yrinic acid a,c-diamide adenosyltransferase [Mycobacteriales bacterium]
MSPQGKPEHVPADGLTTRVRRAKPRLIVHTGVGKGKSTAAFGLMLRGWAQGWDVGVFQFVKSSKWKVGEEAAAEKLGIDWHKMGSSWSWIQREEASSEALARQGWAEVKAAITAETYRMLILDEFTYVMSRGWVPVDEVLAVLTARTGTQHVVITGRGAPQEIVDAADIVTEMTKVKHPFDQGEKGQKGIEW